LTTAAQYQVWLLSEMLGTTVKPKDLANVELQNALKKGILKTSDGSVLKFRVPSADRQMAYTPGPDSGRNY
jgi:hypothetical protein